MLSGKDNPFTIGFFVDVERVTKQGRPVAYQVIHLYEVLDEDKTEDVRLNATPTRFIVFFTSRRSSTS